MDDTYIMVATKVEAIELCKELEVQYKELLIFVNKKKFAIKKINNWQTFLKINYKVVSEHGRLVRKVHSSAFIRERRRLKKFRRLIDDGKMTFEDVAQCYRCWRGNYRKYDSGVKMYRLRKYFIKLFYEEIKKCPKTKF